MASTYIFVALALISAIVAPALATDFIVGEQYGWRMNYNYQAWAGTKDFHVGDRLIFRYPAGVHNVHRADSASFQNCTASATSVALITGYDTITLTSEGKKWYLCTIPTHCSTGYMKLAITVLPQVQSPAEPPAISAATRHGAFTYTSLITAVLATFVMMIRN